MRLKKTSRPELTFVASRAFSDAFCEFLRDAQTLAIAFRLHSCFDYQRKREQLSPGLEPLHPQTLGTTVRFLNKAS